MTSKGIGFGKTILFGEHFVVYGLPAIAAALENYTEARVTKGYNDIKVIDNRPETAKYKDTKKEEIQREIEALKKYFRIDERNPLKVTLSGSLVCASGIGASAALAASIARAINQELELKLTDEQINEAAFEAECAGSGPASGIDNTCAVFGGFIIFEKNQQGGPNKIEKLKVKKPVEIVLANSGITQETKKIVLEIKELKEKKAAEFEKTVSDYRKLLTSAIIAIQKEDWKEVGLLMNKNHELLQKITVSCKELDEMQKIALEAGALGAKLTGTGRGGLLIALTPGKELQEKVAGALGKKGFSCQKTKIGV